MPKIKVMICDDLEYLCKYFKNEINQNEDMECVAYAVNSTQCIEMVLKERPDVILMDIQMETNDAGINLIPKVLAINPKTKIIILTIHENDEYIFRALTLGAIDYMIKTTPIEEILKVVREVSSDTNSLSPKIAKKILSYAETVSNQNQSILYMFNLLKNLTTAEFEVLSDFYDGLSYKEISKKRVVEESTLRSQVSKIIKKLDVSNMKTLIKNLHEINAFEIFNRNN